MNRKQSEKLLAAYLVDALDAATRAELEAALETDAELRERLADMRMAFKLLHKGLEEEVEPRLSDDRIGALLSAAAKPVAQPVSRWGWRRPLIASIAAIAAAVVLVTVFTPSLQRSRELARRIAPAAPAEATPSTLDGRDDTRVVYQYESSARRSDRSDKSPDSLRGITERGGTGGERSERKYYKEMESKDGKLPAKEEALKAGSGYEQFRKPKPPGKTDDNVSSPAGLPASPRRGGETFVFSDGAATLAPRPADAPSDRAKIGRPGEEVVLADEVEKLREKDTSDTWVAHRTSSPGSTLRPQQDKGKGIRETTKAEKSAELSGLKKTLDSKDKDDSEGQWEVRRKKPNSRTDLREQERSKDSIDDELKRRPLAVDDLIRSIPATLPATGSSTESRINELAHETALPPASTFREVPVNPWVMTERERFSTFASDVDSASYALCRAYLRSGYLPPRGAVRMEEFINAFDYNYPRQARGVFNVFAEAAAAPFADTGEGTTLLKIGVQGRVIGREGRKSAHLVFVIDTSGSMATPDRMPLIQEAIRMLVDALGPNDYVSLVTFSRQSALLLECVPASRRDEILAACAKIRAGGPTNLLAGLEAGYDLARREFHAGRINRVILCSDGAANIGQTDAQAILDRVADYRRHGITLTVAGCGRGGYNDELLETLAKRGDGSYLFIDTPQQARQAFVEKMNATLQTIALDARIQVEFNPERIRRYRLIGYEKRIIAKEDFRNDAIDAAEVGSGQSSTALYELELTGSERDGQAGSLGTVYVRYRNADTREIEEISHRLEARIVQPLTVEENPRFYLAACAARYAEILRESPHAKNGNMEQVERVMRHVSQSLPLDDQAREMLWLVQRARNLPKSP